MQIAFLEFCERMIEYAVQKEWMKSLLKQNRILEIIERLSLSPDTHMTTKCKQVLKKLN